MTLKLTRLSPALGAEVHDVDLSQPISEALLAELRAAWLQHQVLFFRGQTLSPRQQRDFAARFGPLHTHPIYPQHPDAPEIMVLDTEAFDLRDNAIWHTDVTFNATPPLGAVLAARKLPEVGGDTLWASGTAAFAALSPALQTLLTGLTATHDFVHSFPLERYGTRPEDLARWEQTRRDHPPVSHPVIRTHPETGQKALFVNDGFTTRINELSQEESDALLPLLFQHYAKPEFTIRWRWQAGDVAFWDNRVTQHYATDDYRPAHRIMHRATIQGDVPF